MNGLIRATSQLVCPHYLIALDEAIYLADRVFVLGERPGRVIDVIPVEAVHLERVSKAS
jgi:ABC-type nitrate/sulfonate/bicarbonate transport system ATPase subunit